MVNAPHKVLVAKKQKGKGTEKDSYLFTQSIDENFSPFYMISEDGPLEFKLSFQIYSSILNQLKFVSFLDAHSFNSCVFFLSLPWLLLLLLFLLLLLIKRKICNG